MWPDKWEGERSGNGIVGDKQNTIKGEREVLYYEDRDSVRCT